MYCNHTSRGFGDFMRYTEKEYDFEYGDMKEWLQNIAALFIVAPLRLFNEISTKIVYLNRSLIIKVLNLAVVLNLLFVGAAIGIKIWLGELNIWLGKVPIVLQLASLAIVIVINLWYRFYDFIIYQQLDKLLPLKKKSPAEEESIEEVSIEDNSKELNLFEEQTKNNTFAEFEDSLLTELTELSIPDVTPMQNTTDIDSIAAKLAEEPLIINSSDSTTEEQVVTHNTIDLSEIDDTLLEILNEDLLDDSSAIEYQHIIETEIDNLAVVDDTELEQEMDDSTDPSKYVSEEGLFKFLSTMGLDSFGSLDNFGNWETPESFNLTS